MGWTILFIWLASIVVAPIIASAKKFGIGSILGFTVLAFFIGPFSVFAVILSSPPEKTESVSDLPPIRNIGEVKREILSIKKSVNLLLNRLGHLEQKLNRMEGKDVLTEKTSPEVFPEIQKAEEAEIPEIIEESCNEKTEPVKAAEDTSVIAGDVIKIEPGKEETDEKPGEKSEGFEVTFGKVWLNRIGVVVFFLGMAFLLSYTFLFLNPAARIALGYLVAAGFFLWGRYLENKEQYVIAARGIQGGAWGLLYLTTYATHFIEATRIINSSTITLFLLMLVSYASVIYNLRFKNWVVTSITFILAFITSGLGGIEFATVAYFALLTVSISYITYRLKWHEFLMVGILGTNLTALWLIYLSFAVKENLLFRLRINMGILTISWLIFSITLFLMEVDNKKKLKAVVSGILINAMFYTAYSLVEIYRMESALKIGGNLKVPFLMILGWLYLGAAYLYNTKKKEVLVPLNVCIAFVIFALSALVGFPSLSITYFLLMETILIFIVGVIYKEVIYRKLSWVFSILILGRLIFVDLLNSDTLSPGFLSIKHSSLIFLFAAVIYLIMEYVIKRNETKNNSKFFPWESNLYACASFTFLAIAILLGFSKLFASYMLLVQMVAVFIAGIILKEGIYRKYALALGGFILIRLLSIDLFYEEQGAIVFLKHNTPLIVLASLCFYAMSLITEIKGIKDSITDDEIKIYPYLVIFSAVLLTFLMGKEIPQQWLTTAWGVLGIVILGLGFFFKRKIDRICGLIILSLTLLKLILIDMSGMNTVYKVVGFILLGLILLGASMVYSKFMVKKE